MDGLAAPVALFSIFLFAFQLVSFASKKVSFVSKKVSFHRLGNMGSSPTVVEQAESDGLWRQRSSCVCVCVCVCV